jgi:nitroreductase
MDFFKTIERRHSVRSYKNKPVSKENLDKVLEAARLAPTAKNLQAFKVFVIPTQEYKGALKKIYSRDWICEPPYVLLVCTENGKCWVRADGKPYGDVDSAIIMDHMILAATALGLGTCWIGAFNAAAAKEELSLPDGLEPIAFTPLGYENKKPFVKKRKEISELAEYK